jgi:hypothetical protein
MDLRSSDIEIPRTFNKKIFMKYFQIDSRTDENFLCYDNNIVIVCEYKQKDREESIEVRECFSGIFFPSTVVSKV